MKKKYKILITILLIVVVAIVAWKKFQELESITTRSVTLSNSETQEDKELNSTTLDDKEYSVKALIELLPFVEKSIEKPAPPIVKSAREQIGKTIIYDPKYVGLSYPNGDVPRVRGVCTDVVIRALRDSLKIDLQKEVHEDMLRAFSSYPTIWGAKRTDKNIDHRRVPNLKRYFKRKGYALSVTKNPKDYRAGDIVTCKVGGRPHIMIVSSKESSEGVPYIIHNIGWGTRENDELFRYPIDGHYRIK